MSKQSKVRKSALLNDEFIASIFHVLCDVAGKVKRIRKYEPMSLAEIMLMFCVFFSANALAKMETGQGPPVDLTTVKCGGKSVAELTGEFLFNKKIVIIKKFTHPCLISFFTLISLLTFLFYRLYCYFTVVSQ